MSSETAVWLMLGGTVLLTAHDWAWRWLTAQMMKLVHEQRDLINTQGDLIDKMRAMIGDEDHDQ